MKHSIIRNIRPFRLATALILILSLIAAPFRSVADAEPMPVLVEIGSESGAPGDTVNVTVSIDPGYNYVLSYNMNLTYDSDVLELVPGTPITDSADFLMFDTDITQAGKISIDAQYHSDFVIEEKTEVLVIPFRIKAGAALGASEIRLDTGMYTADDEEWNFMDQFEPGTVTVQAPAQVPETIKVGIGSVSGTAGETVDVPVTVLEASKGAAAYGMQLDFDPAALEVVSITGASGNHFESTKNQAEGWLKAAWADDTGGDSLAATGDILFTVAFKIKEDATPGSKTITVRNRDDRQRFTFTDTNVVEMDKTLVAGQVTVQQQGPLTLSAVPGDGVANLLWTQVAGATTYTIYQSESLDDLGTPATQVKIVNSPISRYQATDLVNGKTYYFAVQSANASGNRVTSNTVPVMPDDMAVADLQNLLVDINSQISALADSTDKTAFESEADDLQATIDALLLEEGQADDSAAYAIFYQKMSQTGAALFRLQIQIMQLQVSELESKVSTLEGDKTALQNTIDTLNGQIEALQDEVENLTNENGDLSQQVATLTSQISTLQGQITDLNDTIEELQQENDTLKQEKLVLQAQIESLQSQVTTLEGKVTTLEGDNTALQNTIDTLNGQIEALQDEINGLTSGNEDLEQQIAALKQQIKNLQAAVTKFEQFTKDVFGLQIGYAAGDAAQHVSQDLALPHTGTNGTSIEWQSSNDEYVNGSTGKVTRPSFTEGDVFVTLTSTFKLGTLEGSLTHLVRVVKADPNDREAAALDKKTLDIRYTTGDSIHSVTQNVYMDTAGEHGTTISWTSSHPEVIDASGHVTRPGYLEDSVLVTLTAEIARGDATESKVFVVHVLKRVQTAQEAVDAGKQALEIGYAPGESKDAVKSALILAESGSDGTSIRWESSAPGIVSGKGEVHRPSASEGSQLVTLTATIDKEGTTTTKEFKVMVAAYAAGKPMQIFTEGEGLGIRRDASGIRVTAKVERRDTAVQPEKAVVVFELLQGNEAVSIVAFEKNALLSEKVTAGFFRINGNQADYRVIVFVYDELSNDLTRIQTSLADPIELK